MEIVKTASGDQDQQGRPRTPPAPGPPRRDHLERAVLEALWDHPDGITATEVLTALDGREVAVTTVLTVLERLRAKGLVTRWRRGRPYLHRATTTREQSTAAAMLDALAGAADRSATLAHLVAAASVDDLAALRRALLAPERTAGQARPPVCGPGHDQATTATSPPDLLPPGPTGTGCGGTSGLCGCCTCEPGCACCSPLAATA